MRNEHIKEQMTRYHSGDPVEQKKAIEEILNENMPLVDQIINKAYKTYKKYYQDMRQAGYVGIIEALQTYNPETSKPSTYFTFYIKHYISEYCNNFVQGISSHYSNRIRLINNAKAELEAMEMEATPINIASITGIRLDAVVKSLEMEKRSQLKNCVSESYMDTLVTHVTPSPEEEYEEQERMEYFHRAVMNLPEKEKVIIIAKYGLFDAEPKTNADIAEIANVPVAQIRRYVQNAFRILREDVNLQSLFTDYIRQKSLMDGEISLVPNGAAVMSITVLENDDYEDSKISSQV